MISAGYGFLAVLLPAAALFLWDRWRMRRLLRRLDQMLDEAIRGDFREEAFDETLLSALETKLAHYLSLPLPSCPGRPAVLYRLQAGLPSDPAFSMRR